MDDLVKLLAVTATILGAIAWPVALSALVWFFRKELKEIARRIPVLFDRVSKASVAGIKIELERVADAQIEEHARHRIQSQKEFKLQVGRKSTCVLLLREGGAPRRPNSFARKIGASQRSALPILADRESFAKIRRLRQSASPIRFEG